MIPLVKAWLKVDLALKKEAKLYIAGPDDGELAKLLPLIENEQSVVYLGAIYGEVKQSVFEKTQVYLLPSYSEGFPSSVVEAMSYGLVPVLTQGCNFNEVFEKNLGYKTTPFQQDLVGVLHLILGLSKEELTQKSLENRSYIQQNLTLEVIGEKLNEVYFSLLQI